MAALAVGVTELLLQDALQSNYGAAVGFCCRILLSDSAVGFCSGARLQLTKGGARLELSRQNACPARPGYCRVLALLLEIHLRVPGDKPGRGKQGRESDRNVLMYSRTGSAGPTPPLARIVARR